MRPHKTKRGYYEQSVDFGKDETTGKRKRKRVWAKTPAELRARVAELEDQRDRGMAPEVITVADFLTDTWLPLVQRTRRASTYKRYELDVRKNILPGLPRAGRFPIAALSVAHVQSLVDAMAAAGLAPRTIRNMRATLRKALNVARARRLVGENVAELTEIPQARKPKIRPLTRDEAIAFLTEVRDSRFEALYWMALLLGLRRGELLGPRLSSLDLEAGTVHICEGMQRVDAPAGGSKLVWIPTKSEAGDRVLPLPAALLPVLQKHLARLADEQRTEGWEEHDLLFPSECGTPKEGSNLHRSFKPALARAGLPDIRFHDLRHTAASRWIADGGDLRSVSEALGHSSAAFTLSTYAHTFDAAKRAMIEGSAAGYAPGSVNDRVIELPERAKDERGAI